MVLEAGLALQLQPFGGVVRLVDQLAAWQRCVVYWGCGGVRVVLLSEVANSWCWWGTRDVLPLAADAAGEAGARGRVAGGGRYGGRYPPAVMMAAEVSVVFFFCVRNGREEGRVLAWVWWLIIVYELFAGRKEKRKA